MARIRIGTPPAHGGRVSPYLFGNFVELLADTVPALRAELLGDGHFEGPLPPADWCHYDRSTDWREPTWTLAGSAALVTEPVPAVGRCLELPAAGAGAGQAGLDLAAGTALSLRLRARALAASGEVAAVVRDEAGALAEAAFTVEGGAWRSVTLALSPGRDARDALFALEHRGGGPVRLDRVSLASADSEEGWRRDALAATRALKPGLLRWGGSVIENYDWEAGIGDPDRRLPFENRPWGHRDPNSVGMEEFLQFCRLTGAEPLVCVRFTGARPADAARQVEYANGSPERGEGARRARNGRAAPWGVRFWQVGNEVSGPEYEAGLPDFCRAMRAADPGIQLLAAYPSPGVFAAASLLDHVCPHHYDCADLEGVEADLRQLIATIEATAPHLSIGVTEWNTTAGDWGAGRGRLWTLENALAGARYLHLLQRYCHRVRIACRSNLANSYCSGALQIRGRQLVRTPAYHMLALYAPVGGGVALACTAEEPLDVAAVDLPDRIVVTVVNPWSQGTTAALASDRPLPAEAIAWRVCDTAGTPRAGAINRFDAPERVRLLGPEPCDPRAVSLPPLSILRIELPRQARYARLRGALEPLPTGALRPEPEREVRRQGADRGSTSNPGRASIGDAASAPRSRAKPRAPTGIGA